MILHWDGSYPLIMLFVLIVYFFIYRKEQKEIRKSQKEIDKISAKLNERETINQQASSGKKTFLRSEFKELNDNELKLYTDIYGVKFV